LCWLEYLERNRISDLSLFSSVVGTRRSHTEQGQGSKGGCGSDGVLECRQKFICGDSPVGRGVVMVWDPVAVAPLLMVMSAHSVAESLQDCFVEFLIYRLSCRDELRMNQPVNVKERNQHGLDIGLHLPSFLRSSR